MHDLPSGLLDKLRDLISPPGADVPVLSSGFADLPQLRGAIVHGDLTDLEWGVLFRALVPGAHVVLVPGDPVGDAGACAAEDAGLEVRDALFLAETARDLLFVPKASRKEREEGLEAIPVRAGHEAVKRKEGSAGLKNARAGAGRTAKEVRNHHPTCKPVGIMAAAVARLDVSSGPVLDPFAGSGTTAVACVRSGIRSYSIERDPEFAKIGAARIRHELRRRPGAGV